MSTRQHKRYYGLIWLTIIGWLLCVFTCQAAAPVVTNVTAAQRTGTKLVDINYDLCSDVCTSLAVSLLITTNIAGTVTNYDLYLDETHKITNFSGSGYGSSVITGATKTITWNAGADLGDAYSSTRLYFKVLANDLTTPTGFARIPAGSFTMGDTYRGGGMEATNLHTVYISEFYMEVTDVTALQWTNVYTWAITNGYTDLATGASKATNKPVYSVSWSNSVQWCNARSEMEGLTPCYYTNTSLVPENIYRTGPANISSDCVIWNTNGYRLPTEAEWEKAARGGEAGHRLPWSDSETITHSRANYQSRTNESYDVSPTRGYHPTVGGTVPYPTAVGRIGSTNGYGLYDMAGNMFQWCWDFYDPNWYSKSACTNDDTRGPTSGWPTALWRVVRCGMWQNYNSSLPVASRGESSGGGTHLTLRCVRSQYDGGLPSACSGEGSAGPVTVCTRPEGAIFRIY